MFGQGRGESLAEDVPESRASSCGQRAGTDHANEGFDLRGEETVGAGTGH